MITTLITDINSQAFLGAVSSEALRDCDLFIGVIDETTDTAVGVLAAEAVYDHSLAIRYIYVSEKYRNMGAGSALIDALKEASAKLDARFIFCTHIRMQEKTGIYELLEKNGFSHATSDIPFAGAKLSDMNIDAVRADCQIKQLKAVNDDEWYEFTRDVSVGSVKSINGTVPDVYERSFYDAAHSYFAFDREKRGLRCGELLCVKTPAGICVNLLGAKGDDIAEILYALIGRALEDASKDLSPDTMVLACLTSDKSGRLIRQLSGDRTERIGESVTQIYKPGPEAF